MEDQTATLPLDQIIEPRTVLRLVNRDTVEYLELRDSLAKHGFWNSISVRPSARVPGKYEIIDGLYRFTAARELGLPFVPCIIKHHVTDDEVIAAQIQANAIRPETKPVEFAQQLKRILTRRPEMALRELAVVVKKSPKWLGQMLGLLDLKATIQSMVDRGEIPLANAYILARMPSRLQHDHLDKAKLLPPREFKALAAAIIKQFKEAVHQGKLDRRNLPVFEPVPHLRPLKDILAELEGRQCGALTAVAEGCKSVLDGWYAALRWAAHLDRKSVEEQRVNAETRTEKHLRRYLEAPHDAIDEEDRPAT
jgi:ParB/RepB/Spo0J family partition protein